MFNKPRLSRIKSVILYTLSVFFILSSAYFAISLYLQVNSDIIQKKEILNNEQRLLDVEQSIISNKVSRLISDVLYISDSLYIDDYGTGDYSKAEQQWLAFSNRKKVYDQIRFIDLEGNEVIRVNYSDNGAYLVAKDKLQNKKDRYFYQETISLDKNQVYISKLDLNVEGDQVEQPIKPMIRLSVPYYGKDGKLKGIVILNYLANDLLGQINSVASTSQGNVNMLNSDGYWVYNRLQTYKEWTFMYNDGLNISFANEFPDEWNTIKSGSAGFLVTENGVFNYTDVMSSGVFTTNDSSYKTVLGMGDWYIISYISPNSNEGLLFSKHPIKSALIIMEKNNYVYLLILFVSVILSELMLSNKKEKDKTKYYSEYDEMTGVFNRRAGFEKMKQLYKYVPRNDCKISVCFIDINGLKEVNDHFGHVTGDDLILSVTGVIKKHIRQNDIVARLGGDEFLIILNGADEDCAEMIWQRIVSEFNQINDSENRAYLISVSHGIETFRCVDEEDIDEVVNRADEKMYNEKRNMKENLNVIRII